MKSRRFCGNHGANISEKVFSRINIQHEFVQLDLCVHISVVVEEQSTALGRGSVTSGVLCTVAKRLPMRSEDVELCRL